MKPWPITLAGCVLFVGGSSTAAQAATSPVVQRESDATVPDDTPPPVTTGAVSVSVTYSGSVPKSSIPDEAGHRHELLSVDRKSGGLRYVVAYLTSAPRAASDPPLEEVKPNGRKPEEPVVIDQVNHQFVPRLIAVSAGSPVRFTNGDLANHNVRASSFVAENAFSVFVPNDGRYEHRFRADRKSRPVVISCDIHPWMKAWVYVFDHPYFAVSDAGGLLQIEAAPPGIHRLELRQPDLGYRESRDVEVTAGMTTHVRLKLSEKDAPAP